MRELFGRQTRVMQYAIPSEQFLCGKVNGKVVKETIPHPSSTHALMDLSCARKLCLYRFDTTCYVELADGTFARLYRVTEKRHFEFVSIAKSVKSYVMEAHSSYEVILGLNWLRAVNVDGKFGKGIYQVGTRY